MNGLLSSQIKFLSLKIQHRNIHLAGKNWTVKILKLIKKNWSYKFGLGSGWDCGFFFRLNYY